MSAARSLLVVTVFALAAMLTACGGGAGANPFDDKKSIDPVTCAASSPECVQ